MKQVTHCPVCNNELTPGYKGAKSLSCSCTYFMYHTVWIYYNSLDEITSYSYAFPYKEYNVYINADRNINKFGIYLIEDSGDNKSTMLFRSEWKEFENFDFQKEFAIRIADLMLFS